MTLPDARAYHNRLLSSRDHIDQHMPRTFRSWTKKVRVEPFLFTHESLLNPDLTRRDDRPSRQAFEGREDEVRPAYRSRGFRSAGLFYRFEAFPLQRG